MTKQSLQHKTSFVTSQLDTSSLRGTVPPLSNAAARNARCMTCYQLYAVDQPCSHVLEIGKDIRRKAERRYQNQQQWGLIDE